MKLEIVLLASVTIASRKERRITDDTKCCGRIKVIILPFSYITLTV